MPLIGSLIGWGTNLLAIKLIFRPINPLKVPLLGLELQGLIPKRRLDISRNIGEAVENEILSSDEIIQKLTSDDNKKQLMECIKKIIIRKTCDKLPGFIPFGLKTSLSVHLGETISRHGGQVFEEIKTELIQKTRHEINLGQMVEDKINSFDLERLETMILRLSRKELKQIEVLGGVIGFFIGLIQALISFYVLSGA
ncbi:MAG: DUF445 family protein [Thermoanaerobacterales bacterium]|nr:DUF445 family protein [Thermoanaerobacterales bacterium]